MSAIFRAVALKDLCPRSRTEQENPAGHKSWFVLYMRVQVILDSPFARPGSASKENSGTGLVSAMLTNRVIPGALSTGQQNYFKKFADDERTSFAYYLHNLHHL